MVAASFAFAGVIMANRDDHIAALTIALEARGERPEGQRAVGEVLRNRSRRTGRPVSEEALRPLQFSAWNGRKLKDAEKRIKPHEYEGAMREWKLSERSNVASGATHYYNPKLASPKWDFKKLKRTASVGAHEFFDEPGWGKSLRRRTP